MATVLHSSGTQTAEIKSINAVSAANPAQVDTTAAHGWATADRVVVRDHLITATSLPNDTVNNYASVPDHAITNVDTDSFTLDGINNASAGGVTGTVSKVHIVATVAVAGVYQFYIDLVNLAANDVLEIFPEYITLTGGTRRRGAPTFFYGAQPVTDRWAYSQPFGSDLTDSGSLRVCIVQHYGTTGRAFPWKLLRYT